MEAFSETLDLMSDGLRHPHLCHQLHILMLQGRYSVYNMYLELVDPSLVNQTVFSVITHACASLRITENTVWFTRLLRPTVYST